MAILDVLIVVDAPRIIKDHGKNDFAKSDTDTSRYVQLKNDGKYYVYMIGTWYAVQNQGESELDVFARPGDQIRWRMTSISMGGAYQCVIKEFVFNNGAGNLTPPALMSKKILTPELDPNARPLGKIMHTEVDDVFWESTVLNTGPVTYHTKFAIFAGGGGLSGGGGGGGCGGDGGDGNCGGYQYDPFINKRL